jgi:hypothetical protein
MKAVAPQADQDAREDIEKCARKAGLVVEQSTDREARRERKELQEHAREVIDGVMTEAVQEEQNWVDESRWKLLWNLPPLAVIGLMLFYSGDAFVGARSLGASYYIHAAVVLVSILWCESWLLSQLFKRRSDSIGDRIVERFLEKTSELGGGYARILTRLQQTRCRMRAIRDEAEECHNDFAEQMHAEGLSTPSR